ncbi:MAG: TlpA disulfide reductase family protein [Gammaproteobacteria bacterium]|nr:TlpA disulfide reductase family protein [Gammaproteobacteria bacterium]
MTRSLATRCLLIGLLAVIVTLVTAADDSDHDLRRAPPFTLFDPAGDEHQLGQYAGRVLVVNFWASWCAPCRAELPSMNRAAGRMRSQPVDWLAINVGEDRQAVTSFTADYPIDFTVLLDVDGTTSQNWRVTVMPTTLIIDRNGFIVHRVVGQREWDDEKHLRMVSELLDD